MKLYLNVNRPKGKTFRLFDLYGRLDKAVKPIVLYPDKPTEVPSEIAERLLEQDPNLVSKKPYDGPKEVLPKVTLDSPEAKAVIELLKSDLDKAQELLGLEVGKSQWPDNPEQLLAELSDVDDFKTLGHKGLDKYGSLLCLEYPPKATVEVKAELLEKACAGLAEAIK